MKYIYIAAVLIVTTSSAFAESKSEISLITTNGPKWHKNISEAQDREDAIKANLDEKPDSKEASEQKSENSEE